MNPNQPHDVKETVLTSIREGGVSMRPKIYFVIKAALVLGVAFLVLLLSIFIASFIVFSLRLNGHDSLLLFGSRGWILFFELFPWLLAALDIGLLVLLEWLLRRFRFAYRRSALYLLLTLLVVLGTLGVAFDIGTHFNDDRFEEAERGELPFPFGEFYKFAHTRPPERLGIFRGVVVTVGEETFIMTYDDRDRDGDDGTWTVFFPESYEEVLEEGNRVYVAGDAHEDGIHAYGIRILER